jgi:hypothetical protein
MRAAGEASGELGSARRIRCLGATATQRVAMAFADVGVGTPFSPKFSLVVSVYACKTWCFAIFGWRLLGYAGLTARSSNARFWTAVGVVSCW